MGYRKGEILKTAFETYVIQAQKGQGGSGEVYEVRDSDGKQLAAKILDPSKADSTRLKRFRNEIHFCTRNKHTNIVQVQDTGITDKGAAFYVMPLYSGTLRDLMSKGIQPEGVLPYFGQILDGLEAAHAQRVWHRDVKPENVLFAAEHDRLVIADFGIAHFEEEELLTAVETKNDMRLANFVYSAPEQRARGQIVNNKADIYALGLILNEMFTRAIPQGTAARRVSDVSRDHGYVDALIDLMLRQDQNDRPTIGEIKQQLVARGNEFLSEQRLNSLKSEVIPETEVDDPIIRNPITITAADYQNGQVVFQLSVTPPPNWIRAFQRPNRQWSSFAGHGPEAFMFSGSQARIPLSPGIPPQQLVNYAKSYVELANRQYAEVTTAAHHKRIAERRELLRKQTEEEERRLTILSQLKV